MNVKTSQDILELLNSGWIYIEAPLQFMKFVFSVIPESDKFQYKKGWFIHKSELLYKMLKNLGMDTNSNIYDSCILIYVDVLDNYYSMSMFSLKDNTNFDNFDKVSEGILKSEIFKKS